MGMSDNPNECSRFLTALSKSLLNLHKGRIVSKWHLFLCVCYYVGWNRRGGVSGKHIIGIKEEILVNSKNV